MADFVARCRHCRPLNDFFLPASSASRVLVCIEAPYNAKRNVQIAFFNVRCSDLNSLYTIGLERILGGGQILIFKRRYLGEFQSNQDKLYIGTHLLTQENT